MKNSMFNETGIGHIIFLAINICLIAVAIYFSVQIVNKKTRPDTSDLIEKTSLTNVVEKRENQKEKRIKNRTFYSSISKRNLFNVLINENSLLKKPDVVQKEDLENLRKTDLKITLWGTVTGVSEVYAVIQDKKNRQQVLLKKGDKIGDAIIKDIHRRKIILSYNGEDQILEMVMTSQNITKGSAVSYKSLDGASLPDLPDFSSIKTVIDKTLIQKIINNSENLMTQIKTRPHYTNGKRVGVMVYGIRADSVFKKLQLRNGDILKEINGEPIFSLKDIAMVYNNIKQVDNTKITLLRRGQLKQFIYTLAE